MAITQFTDIPQRGQPEGEFVPKANDFLGVQLPRFVTEANALADAANADADLAASSAAAAAASSNYVGAWADQSGAASVPMSVTHNGSLWMLMDDLADITSVEPGMDETVWQTPADALGYISVSERDDFERVDNRALDVDFLANTPNTTLTPDAVWDAAGYLSLTDQPTTTLNLSQSVNFKWAMNGERILDTPTGGQPGQQGQIEITLGGAYDLSFASGYVFPNGSAPALSGGAGTVHVLVYSVLSTGAVMVSLIKAVS